MSSSAHSAIHFTQSKNADHADLLPDALVALLIDLHRQFNLTRLALLEQRVVRQAKFDAGALPNFRTDTQHIRESAWQVAAIPLALQDRRVEITGPVDPKMVINALNSGANCYMADFEDSTAPSWANVLTGQRSLRAAVQGVLTFAAEGGKTYQLDPQSQTVLIVRPRGWHLPEKHVLIDGIALSGSIFDVACFAFHNAATLHARDRGPYFYLPKLQCMEEAALWDQVLAHIEVALALPVGTMKATVLIETLPAAFEMHEILHALQGRIVGLNCGRWDYIFSYLKTFRNHPDRVLPERAQVTMTQPFLKSYCELLIQTCHRRGALAMGGMAAQIPISTDAAANAIAMDKVRADKTREVLAGHDGTWVAHPALIPIARAIFDQHMPTPNQLHRLREEVATTQADLIQPSVGTITAAGFANNVEVCLRYCAAWMSGLGCVPIHWLMEDAATAEISRTQIWQWLRRADSSASTLHLDDGTPINALLFERVLHALPEKLKLLDKLPGMDKLDAAMQLVNKLCTESELVEFLTLPAYQQLS